MTRRELLEEITKLRQIIRDLEEKENKLIRTQTALRQSEEQYRVLLSESSDPIFSFTPAGQYQYVNKAFALGVGKPQDQIIGQTIWDVFPKDEADKRFTPLSEVFRTGAEKVIEVRVPRTDGDRYYVTTITPTKDERGNTVAAICSSKEFTERKRMEVKLAESKARFREQYQNHPTQTFTCLRNHLDIIEHIDQCYPMGRKAHFQHEDFLGAAIKIIAKDGPGALTIVSLAKRINAPVGSIYHRYASRDALLAEVWLTIIESFQNDFLKLLSNDGLQATLSCLEWVRRHPSEARIMLLYRMHDLTAGKWPQDLQKRARRLDKELHNAVNVFIKKEFGEVTPENTDRAIFAIYDAPIGIIRRYLRNNKIPPASTANLIRETYEAVIQKVKK